MNGHIHVAPRTETTRAGAPEQIREVDGVARLGKDATQCFQATHDIRRKTGFPHEFSIWLQTSR